MIAKYPGFCGEGWSAKREAWIAEHLAPFISAELLDNINGEAMVANNLSSGGPSGFFSTETKRVINLLNAGTPECEIKFPRRAWAAKKREEDKNKPWGPELCHFG